MSLKAGLEERIKGLVLEDVDIIFVTERHLYDRLSKMPFPNLKKEVRVMFVERFDNLKALSIRDMRKLGWVRHDDKSRLAQDTCVE